MPPSAHPLVAALGRLTGRVAMVGVGNVEAGDDAVGVRLAEALRATAAPAHVVLAGDRPEGHVTALAGGGFDHVVFLDATDTGSPAGAVVWLDAAQVQSRFPQVSTHRISLGLLAQVIEAAGPTRVWLLGIQPATLRPGVALSPTVQETLDLVVSLVHSALGAATRADANETSARPAERRRSGGTHACATAEVGVRECAHGFTDGPIGSEPCLPPAPGPRLGEPQPIRSATPARRSPRGFPRNPLRVTDPRSEARVAGRERIQGEGRVAAGGGA